jgi:amidase
VYALDAIYGVDPLDNYTLAQEGNVPSGGYSQFLATKEVLRGATFGLPWNSFWVYADDEQRRILETILGLLSGAGATIVNGTEILNYETLVSPDGWDWDYGSTRGYPNESEYTVVKVDFYNNINAYLSELENTDIKSIEDIVQYNYDNDGGIDSDQDGLIDSLESGGVRDETYYQALNFTRTSTRVGIDTALAFNGTRLSGLLVPPDVGQSYQIAAQAGYPVITVPAGVRSGTGLPFGLAVMQTAWAEGELVRWGSAIEDLQRGSGVEYKRAMPEWYGWEGLAEEYFGVGAVGRKFDGVEIEKGCCGAECQVLP